MDIGTISDRNALAESRAATSSACASARAERRVAIRRVSLPVEWEGVQAEELGEQHGVRATGAGLGALLQGHDRVVEQLGDDAAGERLDRGALVGRQVASRPA